MLHRYVVFFLAFFFSESFAQQSLPFDFESSPVTSDFVNFDGGETTVVPNPDPSEDNPSAQVAQMIRYPGEVWAGSKILLNDYLDPTTLGGIRMKVYSPLAGSVIKMKLEGQAEVDLDAMVSTVGEWETLVWDFTGLPSGVYNEVVFMLDFGTYGDGSEWSTFLFDDVELFDATYGLEQIDLPIDFEGTTVNYHTTSFAGNFSSLVSDPEDPTNKVVKVLKSWQSLNYSGTTISTPAGMASPIPFTPASSTVTAKVWSPASGIPVRFKAEVRFSPGESVENEVLTTVSGEWETLSFDLSQEVLGTPVINYNFEYDLITLFFDFGNDGSIMGNQIFYFDDVSLGDWSSSTIDRIPDGFAIHPTWIDSNRTIWIQSPGHACRMNLYDLQGNQVMVRSNVESGAVFLGQFASGIYLCELESNGMKYRKKLVLQ